MNCLLRIHVKATTDTTEQTELLVRGICRRLETEDGIGYRFDYRSVDAEDPAAVTREQITVTPAGAKLIRTGSIQSVMEIVPGELRKCDYGTPFGTLVFDILGIGVNGVKAHLKVIYTRLGAASRTEATSLAINLRLISV